MQIIIVAITSNKPGSQKPNDLAQRDRIGYFREFDNNFINAANRRRLLDDL